MLDNGLGPFQKWQIENDAAVLDQCSNRAKPGEHSPKALRRHKELNYPLNMYRHVQNVKAFQARDRRFAMPNVRYINVDFGCGGPFSAECLTGWDGTGLLTHRLHLWSDAITHPKPCNHECLAGWSGADLDTYRQQTWAGDNVKNWGSFDYPKSAAEYVFNHTEHWAVLDYSNVSHLHADQFDWHGDNIVRKHTLPNGQVVHVPETVLVPVPESLDQVLREMSRVSLPEEIDQASIEDILGRLPEAFEEEEPLSGEGSEPSADIAEVSESCSTLVNDPVDEPKPIPVETPEMAEARRQMAREVMREKLKRDFSEGKQKMIDGEDNISAEGAVANKTGNESDEAVNDEERGAKEAVLTTSSSMETICAALPNPTTTQTAANPSTLAPTAPPTALDRQPQDQRHELPPSDPDEAASSPIDDVGDDFYGTQENEEEEESSAGF
ncbi:hypothetical protein HO173_008490 [Letharia columbiana]|uniref:Uncharacterized protein n=1 Tax=Letharia columbiana TaxID=112416 RepID=A0A8H6L2L2_9LECA|nr:uncharacterized protein HO173_008490 [Letharia columbiana]KAF6233201.1 hypothetical protein HO173_008490 [Letharia columbiana]